MDTPSPGTTAAANLRRVLDIRNTEDPRSRADGYRSLLMAIRAREIEPDESLQNLLAPALSVEKDRAARYYVWAILMLGKPDERLKAIALADLQRTDFEVSGRACAMSYLVSNYPDEAAQLVEETQEENGNPYMAMERARAWFLTDPEKAKTMWREIRASTEDPGLRVVLDNLLEASL